MTLFPTGAGWLPRTESELQTALDGGLLDETHTLELKREIPAGKGANKELARDLAQFAIDGGTLVVGVADETEPSPRLQPVELAGLAERVEQVARTLSDPPLPVSSLSIPCDTDPARGYLLVTVPATGTAPHMVDGVYYGRGDKMRIRLSDSAVLRHHRARRDGDEVAHELLEAYVQRDPVPADHRKQAHFFVVAAPVVPRREMLLDAVHGDGWTQVFQQLKAHGMHPDNLSRDRFAPDLSHASGFARRADGAAAANGLTPDRRLVSLADQDPRRYVEDALELELSEDGEVRLMTTRLSDETAAGEQAIFAVMIPVLTRRALGVACGVAEHAGYQGPWLLGVAATGVAGQAAWSDGYRFGYDNTRLSQDQDDYRATTTASYGELVQSPGAVTARLVGRLLRALGQSQAQAEFTTDDDT